MGWKEVLAGTFDLDGELAVNPDGGLKSFGHPIGASGLRMLFECWLQLRGQAGRASDLQRQDEGPHPQPRRRAGRVRELRGRRRLRARLISDNAASAASCNRPFVESALPPSARATPERSVKRPPASSTITFTAARSHRLTAGSAARSNTPSATSTCIQKSPTPAAAPHPMRERVELRTPPVLAPRAGCWRGRSARPRGDRRTDTCSDPSERSKAPRALRRPPPPAERGRRCDADDDLAVVLERDQRPPDRQARARTTRCRRSGRGSTRDGDAGSPIRPSSSPSTAWSGRCCREQRAHRRLRPRCRRR